MSCLQEHQGRGEVVTGLLYLNESVPDVHEMNLTSDRPLVDIPFEQLCPGPIGAGRSARGISLIYSARQIDGSMKLTNSSGWDPDSTCACHDINLHHGARSLQRASTFEIYRETTIRARRTHVNR